MTNAYGESAEAWRFPFEKPVCAPNVLVAVTRDRPAFMKALSRELPSLVEGLSRRRMRQLIQEPKATAWQVQGPPLNADGQPLRMVRFEFPAPGGESLKPRPLILTIRPDRTPG